MKGGAIMDHVPPRERWLVETKVEITWPSGIQQELANVKADQVLTVREEGGRVPLRNERSR